MSRTSDRATSISSVLRMLAVGLLVLAGAATVLGCTQLDGRNRNRKGNRAFRETQFVDAAADYEKALSEVDDPIIHYNLGVAYSKVFKPGYEKPVLLGKMSEELCKLIPKVKSLDARVCVKDGDRHYAECDDKNVCPSSYKCEKDTFCALDSPTLANLAGEHFQVWIKSQPSDEDINAKIKAANTELADAEKRGDNSAIKELKTEIEELSLKDDMRKLMTQLWLDSDQYKVALDYWSGLLKDKPNDPTIMGNLAGINLKANQWRESIEWYLKVADIAKDASAKVSAYQFIGNVAWAKLNSKTLTGADSIEIADRGIGALQKAAELQPENPKPIGLMASIFNFRALAHGASWAAALDRATAQDLQHASRVLNDKAKKAQGLPTTPPAPTPAPAPTAPAPAGASTTPPGKTGG